MLTELELLFCELYVNGEPPFAGDEVECYREVFGDKEKHIKLAATRLLSRDSIQEKIQELNKERAKLAQGMKNFIASNLIKIIKETSTAVYSDRRGTVLSPAPLRSVAVNASKALMELFPIKEANVTKLDIGTEDGASITFNVIVPEKKEDKDIIEEE